MKRVYLLLILFLLVLTSCAEEKDAPSNLEEGKPKEVDSKSNLAETNKITQKL